MMDCRRVLIIDDHRDSAAMLAAVLKLRLPGLSVQVAHDGVSGVGLAIASEHDAVIVDLGLPGMDGARVAAEIRRRRPGPAPLLIVLSGNVAEVVSHQHSQQLFDHALTKPANVDRLAAILRPPG